jgi:hypothetical protein
MRSELSRNLLQRILSLPLEELLLLALALGWALVRLLNRLGTTSAVAKGLAEELSTQSVVGSKTGKEEVSKNGKSLTSEEKDDLGNPYAEST